MVGWGDPRIGGWGSRHTLPPTTTLPYHLSLSLGQVAALERAVDACADDSACLQASKYVST